MVSMCWARLIWAVISGCTLGNGSDEVNPDLGFSPIPDLGSKGLHLGCYHVLGIGETLHDPLRVIIDSAMQDNLLKVSHSQTGILPVVM